MHNPEENVENLEWHKLADSWQAVKQSYPEGSLNGLRFGLHKVCLAHSEGQIIALEDACPHKMIKLSKGKLSNNTVTCPWHQYCFDLKSGEELTGKNIRHLKHYPLLSRADGIYVGLPQKRAEDDEFSF